MKRSIYLCLIACVLMKSLLAQNKYDNLLGKDLSHRTNQHNIHVHNDYDKRIPFWEALEADATSIEADIFLKNGELYVAHEKSGISKKRTLDRLYLSPIKEALELGYIEERKHIQLLIDIKSEAYTTLKVLENKLKKFYKQVNHHQVKVVISGSRPNPEDYTKYSKFIYFDYQDETLPKDINILKKIALISYDFKAYSVWNGKGKIVADEYKKLTKLIHQAHEVKKPIRFWATPDSKSAWKAFVDMKIDFINTDYPQECSQYLATLPKRWVKNTVFSTVYQPSYKNDGKNTRVKNVILMIGDGNGFTQISSAVLANGGDLTMMHLKNAGFMKTQSADDFTTDSAAAGSALATGYKTNNRAIGVDANGKRVENLAEILSKYNFNTGCVTTDEIFGATPSAFYAHQKDRGFENEIAKELLTSKLTLFAGGGSKKYKLSELKKHGFTMVDSIKNIEKSFAEKIGYFFSKGGVPSVLEGRKNALAEITKSSLNFLKNKNKPFFIMIEASHIDSFGHHNDVEGIITETVDFDRAITEAIKFADKDNETLVIVLADHETSGFSIPQGNMKTHEIEGAFFSHDHTGVLVPVFAYGPKSYEFQGCYENTDVFKKILKVLDINKNKSNLN